MYRCARIVVHLLVWFLRTFLSLYCIANPKYNIILTINNNKIVLLFLAIFLGKPYPTVNKAKTRADIFKENLTTAIQFLETLFSDGGDPIDYYIISFNDSEATSFRWNISGETSNATLLPYSISVFNVTAHNCAGPSDAVTVQTYQGMPRIATL